MLVRSLLKGWTNDAILREPEVLSFPASADEKENALIRLRPSYKDFSAGAECGKCGFERRKNLRAPVYQTSISFAGIDEGEDFDDWEKRELERRVETVSLFDPTVKKAALAFMKFVETHRAMQEIIYVPKIETVAVPVNS